jgi:transposase
MVNALLFRYHTKTPWYQMPEEFGSWTGLVKRYTRWRDDGTYQLVYDELEKMGLICRVTVEPAPKDDIIEEDAPLEWWELTNEQWIAVAHLFPPDPKEVYAHSRYKTNRQMLNAILYREYTKLPLRNLTDKYGHWQTINNRHAQWQGDGTLQRVFEKLKTMGVLSKEKYALGQPAGETEPLEWWELTDEQWEQIESLLPPELPRHGKKPKPNRQMLNAILCRYKTDTAWRDLPEKYGHWRTVNDRYTRWRNDGTLQRIMDELQKMDTSINI